MKLIKFGVNNFRAISGGLENNKIDFEGSNTIFIFGQNNVGKSTFLAAYEFMFKNSIPTMDDFYKRDGTTMIEFELELGVDEHDLKYIETKVDKKLESFKSYLSEKSTIKIKRTFAASGDKGKYKPDKPKDITWDPKTETWKDVFFGSIGLIQVFQSLMPKPILIKAMPTEQEVETVVNEILASKAESKLNEEELLELTNAQETVKQLQEKMYNPEAIEAYEEEVNKHFQ